MEEKKQKAGQIRKKEILDAARKVFLSKGFADTVMEDIITETSLSRGGVYYHYKNKVEILHDLMREGMAYRIEKINEFLSSYSGELDGNAVAQMIVDKMLGESELMSVYAIYLSLIHISCGTKKDRLKKAGSRKDRHQERQKLRQKEIREEALDARIRSKRKISRLYRYFRRKKCG